MQKILIIEDERELATILGAYLEVEGFTPVICYDGEEGLESFYSQNPSLVMLDIMLPKQDGICVCKQIRQTSDVPIIMISAKSGEMDKVVALGSGADDYVTKPFSPLELIARVKANLRRYEQMRDRSTITKNEISLGKLSLNQSSYSCQVNGSEIELTTKEFEVLFFLASKPNQVFSKEQIYQGVWGYEIMGDDTTVTVYIKRIRQKLRGVQVDYIKTVWGAGYKLADS